MPPIRRHRRDPARRVRAPMSGTPGQDDGSAASDATSPQARDLVDVRLLEAMRLGGCPICAVRARSERATLDAIINERVLDIGFRAELERSQGFCRRHVAELLPTDRRETGGMLGSSMLLSAVIDRRIDRSRRGDRIARSTPARPAEARPRAPAVHRLLAGRHRGRDRPRPAVRAGRRRGLGSGVDGGPVVPRRLPGPVGDGRVRARLRAGRPGPGRPLRRPAPTARWLRPALEPRPVSPADRGGADRPPTRRRRVLGGDGARPRSRRAPAGVAADPGVDVSRQRRQVALEPACLRGSSAG